MASIKVKFRYSSLPDSEGTIYYQIIHDRKTRQLFTDYHLFAYEWSERRSTVATGHADSRVSLMISIKEHIRLDVERLTKIVRQFDSRCLEYSADDIVEEYKRFVNEYSLFNYMKSVISSLKQNQKIRTSETYQAALNSFRKFRGGKDILLDCITSDIMESYEAWHRQKGNTQNTFSFYARILRATYNRAVEQNIIENRYPFRHVYTGVDKTVKRALPLNIIKRIKSLNLKYSPALDYARDMFMMSFMLRGMSFIDMAYLRKSDLAHGYVSYRRRKTGQMLIIEWTEDMQRVVDKYPENSSDYLLPIIKHRGINERCVYRTAGYKINCNLKKLGRIAGVGIPLTLYVARHSWASAARAKGIPVSVISEGMGHDSEATTQIYLASLDTSTVDRANMLILSSL